MFRFTHVRLLVWLSTAVVPTSTAAATLSVPAGGNLQASLAAARPGDVVELAAGATYNGNFVLPATPGEGPDITVRTGLTAGMQPAPGSRVLPQPSYGFARIVSTNATPAIATAAGAHHWRLQWLEITSTRDGGADLVTLGDGSSAQNTLASVPHHLAIDQCWIHGAAGGQKRGIALNSASTQIRNSSIVDIKAAGMDSQAIAGWNGPGPFTIENNLLEAAGENVMFGGADPSIWNLVPADITVRRNTLRKPIQWRGQTWQVKNIFELKNARRVLIEGNLLENIWRAAQPGYAVVFTPRNQDGRAPWCTVEDVTFRLNIVRHVGGGFNITGEDDVNASAEGRRLRISHNLVYDVDATAWGGTGHFVQIGHGASDIVVDHNTVIHSGNVVMAYGNTGSSPQVMPGFVFRDNLLRHNAYGVMGDNASPGNLTLTMYFPGVSFTHNVLAGGTSGRYPAENLFPAVADFQAQFVDMASSNFALVATSPWRTAATDGASLGVDMAALNAAQAGTTPAPPPPTPGPSPDPTPQPDPSPTPDPTPTPDPAPLEPTPPDVTPGTPTPDPAPPEDSRRPWITEGGRI